MLYTVEKISKEKQKRLEIQENLMNLHKMPLLFMKVNYPCDLKVNCLTAAILKEMDKLITDIFGGSIEFKIFSTTAEGPNIILVIDELPEKIKETAVLIQDKYILGKVMHISVYDDKTLRPVSRSQIGAEQRRCLLCNNFVDECVRDNKHSRVDMLREINRVYIEYLQTFYEMIG